MKAQFASDVLPARPVCEICNAEPASCFTSFNDDGGKLSDWKFSGACDDSTENYIILIDDLFENPGSTVEELAELHKRGNDWGSFMDMMVRFQTATKSYDQ